MLLAGIFGITFSVVPQTPAVIAAGVTAVVIFILLIANRAQSISCSSQKTSDQRWLSAFSVLGICYFVVRAWLSPVKDLGIEDLMLIMPAGILYLSAGILLVGKQAVRARLTLAWVIILLLILHVVSSFMQLRGGEGFSPVYYYMGATPASQGHVIGMYGYYGSFANFAVIAGLLCLSLGVWGRFVFPVRGLIFCLGLVSLSLSIISQSRSAALSLVAGLAVFAVLIMVSVARQNPNVKSWARRIFGVTIAAIMIGSIIACYLVIQMRASSNANGGMSSLFDSVARLNFWPMAYDQWLDFFFIGGGARSFSYLCLLYWNPNLSSMHANPEFVHNEYLQLLTDYGLIGLVIVMIGFLAHYYMGWGQTRKLARMSEQVELRKGSNAMALTIAGMSGMVAMSVHICFDFRTHLLANLLLLVCCAVWVLPIRKSAKPSLRADSSHHAVSQYQYLGALVLLLALGLGSIGLGGHQLWAGMPLVEQRAIKEDGAWKPYEVDRSVWIPVLERSVTRSPRWQRLKRLGILYKMEADQETQPEMKESLYAKAEAACLASIKRNPFDPIPRINLAAMYTSQSKYSEADNAYAETSAMARAREPWFMMHTHWASLHYRMALTSFEKSDSETAQIHFRKAIDLFEFSKDAGVTMRQNNWKQAFTQCLLAYAIFLDKDKQYDEAEIMYNRIEEIENASYRLGEMHFYNYQGAHYYDHSLELYYKKAPERAHQLMVLALESMQMSRRYGEHEERSLIDERIDKVRSYLKFFEAAGIAK